MIKTISILGATGSIGLQTIEILKTRDDYELIAVSCKNNIDGLTKIIEEFPSIKFASVENKSDASLLEEKFPKVEFFYDEKGLKELIKASNCDVYVNAISGFAGLIPSINILKSNKVLLLANKETLVVGGEIINNILDEGYGKLIPLDSEHVAISKCLYGKNIDNIEEIVITASGGSFFNYSEEQLEKVTLEEAIKNPNWQMGKKITIDSNLMINKCYELIEAFYLFRIPFEKISARVNRTSIVHGYVRFIGETRIDVEEPTMKEPIEYGLNFGLPKDLIKGFPNIKVNCLTLYDFEELSYKTYPVMRYAKFIVEQEGDAGCVFNACDEVAVQAFIDGKIKFTDIIKIIDMVMKDYKFSKNVNLHGLIKVDKKVREKTLRIIKKMEKQK